MGFPAIAFWLLVSIAAIFALTGAYFLGVSNASVTEVEIRIPTPEPVIVQVVGEVLAPGVYEFNAQDRVFTAVEAAGGATSKADIGKINLAAFVKDGSRILVPSVLPSPLPAPPIQIQYDGAGNLSNSTVDTSSFVETPVPTAGPIDLNVATIDQLISLPGIGETRANQIINRRDALGGFTTLEQLLEISGIGHMTIESIRPLVVVR